MQQRFYQALLSAEPFLPDGLCVWNGSDPALRFAIYRNNVMASLIDALAENCPVLLAQLGDPFFRAMAAEFIRQHPPTTPLLATYGARLPNWIANFPPLARWPWLADLTRLEMLFISSLHAEDVDQRSPSPPVSSAISSRLCMKLHPSVRLLASEYAVFSLWLAHQPATDKMMPEPLSAERVMLYRVEDAVRIIPLNRAEYRFAVALQAGMCIDEALATAVQETPLFNPRSLLRHMLRYGLIITAG